MSLSVHPQERWFPRNQPPWGSTIDVGPSSRETEGSPEHPHPCQLRTYPVLGSESRDQGPPHVLPDWTPFLPRKPPPPLRQRHEDVLVAHVHGSPRPTPIDNSEVDFRNKGETGVTVTSVITSFLHLRPGPLVVPLRMESHRRLSGFLVSGGLPLTSRPSLGHCQTRKSVRGKTRGYH